MSDLEQPMGNTELRITLGAIQESVKDVLTQATHTNGSVADALRDIEVLKRWRTGLTYSWIGFTLLLLPVLGVTMLRVWDTPQITQAQVQNAVQEGVNQAMVNFELNK